MNRRKYFTSNLYKFLLMGCLLWGNSSLQAQIIKTAGEPAQLDIRVAGDNSIRVTLKPISYKDNFPFNPGVAERSYPSPVISLRKGSNVVNKQVGKLQVQVRFNPLAVLVKNAKGETYQNK